MATDRKEKNNVVVNELYNKKKKGFNFYVQSPDEDSCATVIYFISDKDMKKRNLSVLELADYIKDCCWRYGIRDGLEMVTSYYQYD